MNAIATTLITIQEYTRRNDAQEMYDRCLSLGQIRCLSGNLIGLKKVLSLLEWQLICTFDYFFPVHVCLGNKKSLLKVLESKN